MPFVSHLRENLEEEGAIPTAHTFCEPPEKNLEEEGASPTVHTFVIVGHTSGKFRGESAATCLRVSACASEGNFARASEDLGVVPSYLNKRVRLSTPREQVR